MSETFQSALSLRELRTLADGLDHPEGITVGGDGKLWAGGEAGQIYRIDPDTASCEQVASTEGFVLGLCLDSVGRIYACDMGRLAVLRILPDSGEVEVYCDQAGGKALRAPNWLVFEEDGTLWFSDSGTDDPAAADGTLVRVPPGGGDGEVVETPPLKFPNGLALALDGSLFVIETYGPCVSVLADGALKTYAEIPRTVPDGLALDSDGGLLVSCFQPNRILRIPPGGGDPELVLDDWTGTILPTPTNLAFFGEHLSDLAIASLGGWAVKAVETPWRGQPLHYPVVG